MKGDREYRDYNNQLNLIGKWVTFQYQDVTEDGVPQFPVGLCEGLCDENGRVLM